MDQRQLKPSECIIKQTDGTYAVSAATPAGILTSEQLTMIAELVKQGQGIAKLTTAQSIMIFTSQDKVQSVKSGLAKVGLGLRPDGYTIRNIKACCGKLCKYTNQDTINDAITLNQAFAGREMPNKLKIAISGCPKNCMEALSNDIGFIGIPDGYQLYIGGRGGRRQALGHLLREIKQEEMPAAIEEIIEKYVANGKFRERISHVIEKLGVEVFK